MSSEEERKAEAKKSRRLAAIGRAADSGLESTLSREGIDFVGLSYKNRLYDHLIVVKAVKDGEAVVAFIGASSFGDALLKAQREASRDKLVWKADRYSRA